MSTVKVEPGGTWPGLALPYNLDVGWCETSPWTVADLAGATEHWKQVDRAALKLRTRAVFDALTGLFEHARERGEVVKIFSE